MTRGLGGTCFLLAQRSNDRRHVVSRNNPPPKLRRRGQPLTGPVRHIAIARATDTGGPAPEASGHGGLGATHPRRTVVGQADLPTPTRLSVSLNRAPIVPP